MNSCKEGALADLKEVTDLLELLDLLISWKKSVIEPTNIMEYLGLVANSLDLSFSLPSEKATAVKQMCLSALQTDCVSLRSLASILGNFTWAIPSIPFAQSHYRSMQRFYIDQVHRVNRNLNSSCVLSADARADLRWWVVNPDSVNGQRFFPLEPDLEIYSDASLSG